MLPNESEPRYHGAAGGATRSRRGGRSSSLPAMACYSPHCLGVAHAAVPVAAILACTVSRFSSAGCAAALWPLFVGDAVAACALVGAALAMPWYVRAMVTHGVPRMGEENPSALELVSMLVGIVGKLVFLALLFAWHLDLHATVCDVEGAVSSRCLLAVLACALAYALLLRDWTREVVVFCLGPGLTFFLVGLKRQHRLVAPWAVVCVPLWLADLVCVLAALRWVRECHSPDTVPLASTWGARCLLAALPLHIAAQVVACWSADAVVDAAWWLLHAAHALLLVPLLLYVARCAPAPRCSDELFRPRHV